MGIKEQFLDQRFDTVAVQHPPLPFFHCCEAAYLQQILDSGELKPLLCPEYNEELLYLFYGRPAYKSSDESSSAFNFMKPVCFIVNNDAVAGIKRALAFDSGAFEKYADYLHRSMERREFEITPDKAALNKMVTYFFENNDGYFNTRAKKNLEPYDPIHYQIESFHSIITSRHKQEIDDRKGTIEIQLDYPIPLDSGSIEGIILPTDLYNSPYVNNLIKPLGIPLIEIFNYGNVSNHYYIHIIDKVRDHLLKKNLLHGS